MILLRVLTYAGAALALFLLVRLLLLFVPIREVVVSEDSFYTAEELCDAAEIETGKRMFGFSVSKAKKAILQEYPMLSKVKLRRGLGGTLRIVPTEESCDFYVRVSGSCYVLSRDEFRVLLESEDEERLLLHGLYEITLPDVRVAFVGDLLDFGKESDQEYLHTLLDTLDSSFLAGRISGVRSAERFSLSFIVDGRYDVYIESVSDLDRKLESLDRLMETDQLQGEGYFEINLSDLSARTVRSVKELRPLS